VLNWYTIGSLASIREDLLIQVTSQVSAESMAPIDKSVSGGQTGPDRAGRDFTSEHGIPHVSWCPRGRRAEVGKIAGSYELIEAPGSGCVPHTEWNFRDADATVIFTTFDRLQGGSRKTVRIPRKLGKHLPPSRCRMSPH
jgi:hypothetical protein